MDLEKDALEYHAHAPAGKIFTGLGKPCATQRDLSLAYSPGVAGPCREIHKNEDDSFKYTGRGNLIGVISNGTAVLGLGNIGPHAAKPVMEGKAMLFKKFADIDVFDIELNAPDPDAFIAHVKALEPTFGGINLEDIKAPECFYIEEKLRECMSIPVFHDDQHGTAIIGSAAFLNALEVTGKKIENAKVVFSGGGAAAIATANLFLSLGVKPENLTMCDSKGVVHSERKDLNKYKAKFANKTSMRTLEDAMKGADAFVGVSAPNVLSGETIKLMAENPIIFALANPDPEIHPDVARKSRPDAIIATGRSDFPNQVNNVLGFPFIFRGALDVRATVINEDMKMAAVRAIAALAKEDVPDVVMRAYKEKQGYQFGRDYLIPKPVDPRVMMYVAPAVALAAMNSGVARKKVDIEKYREHIERILGPDKQLIRSLQREMLASRKSGKRVPTIVIPNGNDRRLLKAAAEVATSGDAHICLLGSKKHILMHAESLGIHNLEHLVEVVDPLKDEARTTRFAEVLFELRQRRGVSRTGAFQLLRNHNYFASMMVHAGEADGLVSGLLEPYGQAAKPVLEILGVEKGQVLAGIYLIIANNKMYFFSDCTINIDPDEETLANIAMTTAAVASRYTKDPIRVAMLSFTSFGATRHPLAEKMAKATAIVRKKMPALEIEGEMQADVALNSELRQHEFPFSRIKGDANVLIFPDLNSANIAYKLLTNLSAASPIGPILVGVRKPANILQRSATSDEIVNLIYVTAHQAATADKGPQ